MDHDKYIIHLKMYKNEMLDLSSGLNSVELDEEENSPVLIYIDFEDNLIKFPSTSSMIVKASSYIIEKNEDFTLYWRVKAPSWSKSTSLFCINGDGYAGPGYFLIQIIDAHLKVVGESGVTVADVDISNFTDTQENPSKTYDFDDGELHHMAFTRKSNTLRGYIDGHKIFEYDDFSQQILYAGNYGGLPGYVVSINAYIGNIPIYMNDIVLVKGDAFYGYFNFDPPEDLLNPKDSKVYILRDFDSDTKIGEDYPFRFDTERIPAKRYDSDTKIDDYYPFRFDTKRIIAKSYDSDTKIDDYYPFRFDTKRITAKSYDSDTKIDDYYPFRFDTKRITAKSYDSDTKIDDYYPFRFDTNRTVAYILDDPDSLPLFDTKRITAKSYDSDTKIDDYYPFRFDTNRTVAYVLDDPDSLPLFDTKVSFEIELYIDNFATERINRSITEYRFHTIRDSQKDILNIKFPIYFEQKLSRYYKLFDTKRSVISSLIDSNGNNKLKPYDTFRNVQVYTLPRIPTIYKNIYTTQDGSPILTIPTTRSVIGGSGTYYFDTLRSIRILLSSNGNDYMMNPTKRSVYTIFSDDVLYSNRKAFRYDTLRNIVYIMDTSDFGDTGYDLMRIIEYRDNEKRPTIRRVERDISMFKNTIRNSVLGPNFDDPEYRRMNTRNTIRDVQVDELLITPTDIQAIVDILNKTNRSSVKDVLIYFDTCAHFTNNQIRKVALVTDPSIIIFTDK